MKCIYCLNNKNEKAFNRAEHVMPQSFGLFANNFVLNNPDNKAVCDECNQYFGDNLEIDLARDSFEGIARYDHKIKKPSQFKSLGKRSRLIIKIAEGFFKGAYAYRDYSATEDKIIIKPLPQLGFLRKDMSEYEFFLLENIPNKTPSIDDKYNLNDPRGIVILGCLQEAADKILKEKGFVFKMKGVQDPPDTERSDWLCEVEGKIDQQIMRAIAKIGFNYLSFWEGRDFVLNNSFDPIRKYIRFGEKFDYPLTRIIDKAILADEIDSEKRRLGHIITVNWVSDHISIMAQVSLFNWVTYGISLAKNFSGERRSITRGHFFNVPNGEIFEMGTKILDKI